MKRLIALFCILILFLGCASSSGNRFVCTAFEADLPQGFRPVANANILCFAPLGDPLYSSSITYYTTELNWYFDSFTEQEYETALRDLCGYETLVLKEMRKTSVDGNDAMRLACKVAVDQGEHDLIIYAVQTDQTCFFTLLNRDTDSYVEPFDEMMKTIDLKETAS